MFPFIQYFTYMKEFILDIFSEYYSFIILTVTGIIFVVGIFAFISIRQKINLYRRAVRNYNRGRKQRALLLLSIEIGKNPTNRKAILLRANIESELGLHSLAEKDYKNLISLKKAGDEIDILEIKKCLLGSLYEQRKQLEVFMLADEILSERRLDSDALYYLGALFAEQMKFVDAENILKYVVKNRPGMKQAYFMLALVDSQIGKYHQAIEFIKKARFSEQSGKLSVYEDKVLNNSDNKSIMTQKKHTQFGKTSPLYAKGLTTPGIYTTSQDIYGYYEQNPDYSLLEAAIYYFEGSYKKTLEILDALKSQNPYPFFSKKNLFLLRIEGFCNYFMKDFDRASQLFRKIYRRLTGYDPEKLKSRRGKGMYAEGGYPKGIYSPEGKKISLKKDTYLNEYFRLKEVLTDSGLYLNPNSASIFSGTGLLGLEGLNYTTWAGIDYAFCLVKQEKYGEAVELLSGMKENHPEVIGLRSLITLIQENENDKNQFDIRKEDDIPRRISEKVIKKAGRRYELWEYIEEWEKSAVRPFHIFTLMGFVPKRQINPILLFRMMGKLKSEIERSR